MHQGLAISSGSRGARIGIVILAALALIFVLRTGLSLVLAPVNPVLAHRIDGGNAVALGELSEARMLGARDDADIADVARISRTALRASPLEAVALRNIGFVMAVTGREREASRLLELAGRLSLRDYLTHAWLLDYRFRNNQVHGAVDQADIVLRQRAETWPVILPALTRLLTDPRVIAPLSQALAAHPYWRGTFMQGLGGDGVDGDAAFALLRRLRAIGAPATAAEQANYFLAIAKSAPPSLVYRRWLALLPAGTLPADQALLRDGDFAGLNAPPPFNWQFYARDDVYAELSQGPDGRTKSLYVSFDGNNQSNFVTQKLMLAPGRYRLRGAAFPDGEIGPGQIAWSLRCGGLTDSAEVVKVPVVAPRPAWTRFDAAFEISAGCPSQQLWLIGYPSEVMDPAALWIDQVSIARAN